MRKVRIATLATLLVVSLTGMLALLDTPALADSHGNCPKRPLPPRFDDICRACPSVVDPVVCTVVCAGGPQQKTFTNQCVASCSGYIFVGDCTRTGG